jgi:pimeloyl-ACP methyl ester carboxylesterase
MPYVTSKGIRIHYEVEGNGPPLVLQHGFAWKAKNWYWAGYVDALKPYYRLILVDARGHGASDKPYDPTAYSLSRHVGDVIAVLDALDLRAAHFWGYSMGGWIGFGMAKYAPQRVNAMLIGGQHPYARSLPAAPRPDGSDPQAYFEAFFARIGEDFATLPPERRAETFANDCRALAAAEQDRPSLEDVLPTMDMPCLLYVGEADGRFSRVQACVKQMPNVTFVSFPGLNHTDAFYRADVILAQVTKFLQTQRERPKPVV